MIGPWPRRSPNHAPKPSAVPSTRRSRSQIPRERISELLDELGNTAGRLRGAVDDLRPASAEEVKVLRADLAGAGRTRRDARGRRRQAQARAAPPAAKRATQSSAAAKPKHRDRREVGHCRERSAAAKPRRAAAKPKPPAAGS